MAYVGTPLDTTKAFQSLAGKRFSGDASTTDFTLDSSPNSTLDIEVFVGNVRQDPNSAYTVSGTTLAFTAAPPSGTNNIYVVHQAKAVGTIDPAVGSTLDLNGAAELILDADADTTIAADTDDQIDFKVGGTDVVTLTNSNLVLKGTTPTLTIGDAGAEDTKIVFDGNAQDFYIALDDSADDLVIGLGNTVGTTPAISINSEGDYFYDQRLVSFKDLLTSLTSINDKSSTSIYIQADKSVKYSSVAKVIDLLNRLAFTSVSFEMETRYE